MSGTPRIPNDRVIDGRSFLPQLKGETGNPRDTVIVHYDKDPQSEKPKFRRVRFAYDGRYKLYIDGKMFEVAKDWDEQKPTSAKHGASGSQTEASSSTRQDAGVGARQFFHSQASPILRRHNDCPQ